MHEGSPESQAATPDQPPWDIMAISQTLDSSPTPLPDTSSGDGFSFMVGEVSPVRPFRQVIFEVVPTANTIRLIAPGLSVELNDLPAPIITPTQVVFEYQDAMRLHHLSLTRKGEVTLLDVPLAATAQPDPREPLDDDTAYADQLATQTPPFGTDAYGFDEAEMRRLLDAGLG